MKLSGRFVSGVILGCAAAPAWGAMIAPPMDLGELALQSAAVVEAEAVDSWCEPGAYVPRTVTRFAVVERVSGVRPGETFLVSVPGGSTGELAAAVPGAPRFEAGEVYLLFLDVGGDGLWRVRTMAYGAFHRVELDGNRYLRPLPERRQIGFVGGGRTEIPGVMREGSVVSHLRRVADGSEIWDRRRVEASPDVVVRLMAQDAPGSCRFMEWTSGDGLPVRWFFFDSGGHATVWAGTPGQLGLVDGGTGAVSGGADAWANDSGSLIDLRYGGTTVTSITCTGSSSDEQDGAVVFDDPCDDIGDLSGCSGTLAFGGPVFYTSTESFDGQSWHPAVDLFVVVNDGAECVGEVSFAEMITHELGHGLGFGHHTDPDATMHSMCCHPGRGAALAATDSTCAAYLYPDESSPETPSAPADLQATTVSETRIDVTWVDTADNEDGFRVHRDTGGGYVQIATVGANASIYTDESLSMCSWARYVARAYNGDGQSDPSNSDDATTDGSVPEAPTGVTASASSADQVQLEWTNGSTAQDTVRIERAVGAGPFEFLANTGGITTVYVDGTVVAETTYQYRLRAENGCGSSGWSDEVSVTVPSDQDVLESDFSWTPEAPWTGETVTFTAAAGGEPDAFEWSFGDGSHGDGEQVGHVYGTAGTYTVRLTVLKGGESDAASQSITVSSAPSLVAAAANTSGLNGTSWRTDLAVLNASDAPASATLVLRTEAGDSGGFLPVSLGPGCLLSVRDLLAEMAATGTGALHMLGSGVDALRVMTRTYTGDQGTLGQAIPIEDALRPGAGYVTGLHGGPEFRTNFGVASAADVTAGLSLTLYRPDGVVAGPTLDIPPRGQSQWSVESLFGDSVLQGVDESTLRVETDQPVVAYISVVDEVSGDPVYMSARSPAKQWLVPVVGRGPGEAGTWWDSELVVFNPGASEVSVALEYLAANGNHAGGGQIHEMVLAPRETRRIRRVQSSLWGVDGGLGSIMVSGDEPLAVEVRVSTPRPGAEGSMGQRILSLHDPGTSGGDEMVPWVRQSQAFRTNVGVFNRSTSGRIVSLGLRGHDGALLCQTQLSVGARSLVQRSLERLFGPGALPVGRDGWIEVLSDGDGLVVYGSQVDNVSGDPVYVPGG